MRSGRANSMRSACGSRSPTPHVHLSGAFAPTSPSRRERFGLAGDALDELRIESPNDGLVDAERPQAGGGHRALRRLGELRLLEVLDRGDLESAEKAPRGGASTTRRRR